MKILITGASGLLGGELTRRYGRAGATLWCWRHRHPVARPPGASITEVSTVEQLRGQHFDLAINLAGASIAGWPWTEKRKQILRASRIDFTAQLLEAVAAGVFRVDHWINGSAVGYYGAGQTPVTEADAPGNDFAATLCRDWEQAARQGVADSGISHLSIVRTGLVMTPRGGMLPQLLRPARFGLGARLGDGRQGQSWIHLEDWVSAVQWIQRERQTGVFNLSAPQPVTQDALMRELCAGLGRPYFIKAPAPALKLALGELSALFVEGQFVLPQALQAHDFPFRFPDWPTALGDLLSPERAGGNSNDRTISE